ncbi:hypothetical protein PA598K_06775 [Paenibacillus sp. 598K]|uniref:DUF4188 domain-containing protein n=1 Tax=Paenibacillus sp. 598K TaxID=1117987 RepID=UPI000FFA9700|nr:DUF4188 domain-containing protein [Paenibacillus sp. 598K]GBF78165.1 hypothetical protein PA598K_06775 [Paenibacillus sp. 598K]
MATIYAGRHTARIDGSFVVFIIGMRINKLRAVHRWLPVATSMSPMIQELYKDPDLGLLHASFHLSWRGVTLVQYWRSMEQLEHYARHGQRHLKAWRSFHQKLDANPAVGVFHESYLVPEGNYECVYNHMPVTGLAKAGHHMPVGARTDSARQRLEANSSPDEERMG